jgi:hypothetical protein
MCSIVTGSAQCIFPRKRKNTTFKNYAMPSFQSLFSVPAVYYKTPPTADVITMFSGVAIQCSQIQQVRK